MPRLRHLLHCLLLLPWVACGPAEEHMQVSTGNGAGDPAEESGQKATGERVQEPVEPAPPLPPLSLPERLSEARLMGTEAPDPTPRHYSMRGHINFILEDPNAEIIEQGLDLFVGGPDRMKLILRTTGRQQVFFLADAKNAWLRLPDAAEATEYDSAELSGDSILRWMVLQFPWSAIDIIDWPSANEAWSKLTVNNPESKQPQWLLSLDSNGLLRTIYAADQPDLPVLELSDWRAGSSGQLFPGVWTWHKPWGTLEEHFKFIADESLFLDRLFVPSTQREGSTFFAGISGSLSPLHAAEQIGVAAIPLRWLNQEDWRKQQDLSNCRAWWRHQNQGSVDVVYLLEDGDELADDAPVQQSAANQEWLRWRTFKQLAPEQARKTMNQIAQRSGLVPSGEMWIRQPRDSDGEGERIYLLAVAKKN
jgi:hypothetical protein